MKSSFLAVYLLTATMISRAGEVRAMFAVLLFCVLASGLYSLSGIMDGSYIRFRGFLDSPNGYAASLSAMVPLLVIAFRIYHRKVTKTLFALGIAMGGICIVLAWSRSAWVANATAAIVFLILEKKKRLLAAIGLAAAVAVVLVLTSTSAWSTFYQLARLQTGTTHRTALWHYALEETLASSIVGRGPGVEFGDVLGNARSADPVVLAFLKGIPDREFNPHNYYLTTLVATGIPGLIIFLYFLNGTLQDHWRARSQEPDGRYQMLHSVAISIVAGACVGSFFETGLIMGSGSYTNYFWIALGMVTAISRKKLLDEPQSRATQ